MNYILIMAQQGKLALLMNIKLMVNIYWLGKTELHFLINMPQKHILFKGSHGSTTMLIS